MQHQSVIMIFRSWRLSTVSISPNVVVHVKIANFLGTFTPQILRHKNSSQNIIIRSDFRAVFIFYFLFLLPSKMHNPLHRLVGKLKYNKSKRLFFYSNSQSLKGSNWGFQYRIALSIELPKYKAIEVIRNGYVQH